MRELEDNFCRIIAEIEHASEKRDEDPILEFLLQRREQVARDVQLIDQALFAVAWNILPDPSLSYVSP